MAGREMGKQTLGEQVRGGEVPAVTVSERLGEAGASYPFEGAVARTAKLARDLLGLPTTATSEEIGAANAAEAYRQKAYETQIKAGKSKEEAAAIADKAFGIVYEVFKFNSGH